MSKQNDAVAVVESIERLLGKLKGLLIQVVNEAVEENAMMVAEVARLPKKATAPVEGEQSPAKPKTRVRSTKAKTAPAIESAPQTNGSHKAGLRVPQVRILETLAANKKLTRKQVIDQAKVDAAWLTVWLGVKDEGGRAYNRDKYGCISLIELGYATFAKEDIDDRDVIVYSITKEGKQALKEHNLAKAKEEKLKAKK